MVILIDQKHIKHHPPIEFFHGRSGIRQPHCNVSCLFVARLTGEIVIDMHQRTESLHMDLLISDTVEALCHKVEAPVFFP